MGDVGYLDEQGRFWFCGRKSHRVQTPHGTLFTIPCEAIFNQHPAHLSLGAGGRGTAGPANARRSSPSRGPSTGRRRKRTSERCSSELRERAAAHDHTLGIEQFFLIAVAARRHSPQRQNLPRATGGVGQQAVGIAAHHEAAARQTYRNSASFAALA